jgi:hypothetical protein
LPLLIVGIFRQTGLIPETVTNVLGIIILSIGILILIPKILDLRSRDNMNFDEYKQPYVPDVNQASSDQLFSDDNKLDWKNLFHNKTIAEIRALAGGACIGEDCCGVGEGYDRDNNICVNV